MSLLLWLGFLILLLVSYVDQRKTMEAKNWFTIIGVYLICNLSINFFGLVLPAGVLFAWYFAKKRIKFPMARALVFGLIAVYVVAYTPNLSISQIKEITRTNKEANEFNHVQSVSNFSPDSDINAVLQKTAEHVKEKNLESKIDIKDPHVLFRIWVLNLKNMDIKDLDWLWYDSPRELHYYWQSNRPDSLTTMEYVIFNDVGYMAVFKRVDENSPFALRTIYEFDQLKMNNPMIP